MRPTISFPPSLGSRDSRQLIFVHVTNLYDLAAVYGTDFYHDAATSIKSRLETLGSAKAAVLSGSPYIFIDPETCQSLNFYSRYALCEHIHALLAFETVMCAKEAAFLRTETTTFIDRADKEFHLTNNYRSFSLKNKFWASSTHPEDSKKEYRADMALAVDIFAGWQQLLSSLPSSQSYYSKTRRFAEKHYHGEARIPRLQGSPLL